MFCQFAFRVTQQLSTEYNKFEKSLHVGCVPSLTSTAVSSLPWDDVSTKMDEILKNSFSKVMEASVKNTVEQAMSKVLGAFTEAICGTMGTKLQKENIRNATKKVLSSFHGSEGPFKSEQPGLNAMRVRLGGKQYTWIDPGDLMRQFGGQSFTTDLKESVNHSIDTALLISFLALKEEANDTVMVIPEILIFADPTTMMNQYSSSAFGSVYEGECRKIGHSGFLLFVVQLETRILNVIASYSPNEEEKLQIEVLEAFSGEINESQFNVLEEFVKRVLEHNRVGTYEVESVSRRESKSLAIIQAADEMGEVFEDVGVISLHVEWKEFLILYHEHYNNRHLSNFVGMLFSLLVALNCGSKFGRDKPAVKKIREEVGKWKESIRSLNGSPTRSMKGDLTLVMKNYAEFASRGVIEDWGNLSQLVDEEKATKLKAFVQEWKGIDDFHGMWFVSMKLLNS